jgi:glycosyltransferase involved in cell wall biosynthesis
MMSSHPPTECGLASFNSTMASHLAADATAHVGVVRVVTDGTPNIADPVVAHTWSSRPGEGADGALAALNSHDVAIVQHEYGIYPGADGEDLLPVLTGLTVPSIAVLHTVLANPTTRQKAILEQIASTVDSVVVMTEVARDRLQLAYRVDPSKVTVIPHGANNHGTPTIKDPHRRPHILTWGLIGPGKGLEWGLRALARLRTLERMPTYTIAGKTHPRVLAEHGDAYRDSLKRLVDLLGINAHVTFDPQYRDNASLSSLIRSADLVLLPYDSTEQVTSGVLTEAVAAKVPVVATAFPHAVEVLSDGPGLVVAHRDPVALAGAIRRVLVEPGLADAMVLSAADRAVAPPWPAIARRYKGLASGLLAARSPIAAAA